MTGKPHNEFKWTFSTYSSDDERSDYIRYLAATGWNILDYSFIEGHWVLTVSPF